MISGPPPGDPVVAERAAPRALVAAMVVVAVALATFTVAESWLSVQSNQPDGEDPFFIGLFILWYAALAVAGLLVPTVWSFPRIVRSIGRSLAWWASLTVLGVMGYVLVLVDGLGRDSLYTGSPQAYVITIGVVGVLLATAAAGALPRRRRLAGWAVSVSALVVTWLGFAFAALPHA